MLDRFRSWQFCGVVSGLIAASSAVFAQIGAVDKGFAPANQASVFRSAPRDLDRCLKLAREAISDQRYSDAVAYLGALMIDESINDSVNQDYFLLDQGRADARRHLRQEVQDLIARMPVAGRELYELTYGADARALLDEGLRTANLAKLEEAVRKYFHTAAGYEAALILGRNELGNGRPLAAALNFSRIWNSPARSRYDPELSVMLAACWRLAQVPEKARAILQDLVRIAPNAQITIAGAPVPLAQSGDDPLGWLDRVLGTDESLQRHPPQDWVMFLGENARNGNSPGSPPLPSLQWSARTTFDPTDEELIHELQSEFQRQGVPALPTLQPVVIDPFVVMRTDDELVGVDLVTGKIVWNYPWEQMSRERATRTTPGYEPNTAKNIRKQQLQHRIWNDVPYGQLSSDGQTLYLLEGLGFSANNQANVAVIAGGLQMDNPARPKSYNELVALQLIEDGRPVEGKIGWKVGGLSGTDEPRLAGAFFLGAPLAYRGELYVMAEMNGQIELVALDGKSGALEWKQQLAQIDGLPIHLDMRRRLVGGTLALEGGVLVCPTGTGAVVAVDVANRSLLWGYPYEQVDKANRTTHAALRQVRATNPYPIGQHWHDGAPIIAEGRVVITPSESDKLHCLDLMTGEAVFEPIPRENMLYVAGIHQGIIMVVGQNQVRGIGLSDGSQKWSVPLNFMPSGRGMRSDGLYYLPTGDASGAELVTVDWAEGKIVHRVTTQEPLGNLIGYQDYILSQTPSKVIAFFRIKPLRRLVEQRLKESPDDVETLTLKAELLAFEGEQRDAIATLQRANRLDPGNDRTRSLLVRIMLDALRQDFSQSREMAVQLEAVLESPAQRAEYLRLLVAGYTSEGQVDQAFEAFVKLAAHERKHASQLNEEYVLVRQDSALELQLTRGLRDRFESLYAKAGDAHRQKIDGLIASEVEQVLRAKNPAEFRRFLDYFGSHPLASRVRLALARQLIRNPAADEELLEAELILLDLLPADPELAGPATAALASLLRTSGRTAEAAALYRDLKQRFGEQIVDEQRTGAQLFEEAAQAPALSFYLGAAFQWPEGNVESRVDDNRGLRIPSYYRMYPVTLCETEGSLAQGTRLVYDHQSNRLLVRSADGEQLASVSLRRPDGRRVYTGNYHLTHAKARGHLLILSVGYEVVAIDLLRAVRDQANVILWRELLLPNLPQGRSISFRIHAKQVDLPWGGSQFLASDSEGRLVGAIGTVSDTGVCLQKDSDLLCLHPLTGKPIWRRGNMPAGCRLSGSDGQLLVIHPDEKQVMVIDSRNGNLIDEYQRDTGYAIWATWKQNVLEFKKQLDDSISLRLFNLARNELVWSRSLPEGSKATLVEQDEVAIMQPSGAVEILALDQDATRLKAQVEEEKNLDQIFVMRGNHQYLLLANRPVEPSPTESVQPVPSGYNVPLVNVKIYAFDQQTGKAQWASPAIVNNYGFPYSQSPETPILVFMRHRTPTQGTSRRQKTSVLILDRRDGRLLMHDDEVATTTHFYQVLAQPTSQEASLLLPGRAFVFRFTDQPTPPAPAMQTVQLPPARSLFGEVQQALQTLEGFSRQQVFKPFAPNVPAAVVPQVRLPQVPVPLKPQEPVRQPPFPAPAPAPRR